MPPSLPTPTIARRQFLGSAAATAGALGLASAAAMEPLVRPIPGRVRLSLAAYSMRQYMALDDQGAQAMNNYQFLDYCRELGLSAAELTSYYFPRDTDEAAMRRLRLHCQKIGMTISGGAIRNDFCQAPGPKLDADIAHTKRWIDLYAALGVSVIRIFAGQQPEGDSLQVALDRCATVCQEVCRYAEERGVVLALENHGGVTALASGLLGIVQQVDSPAFGVNFDCGNFRSTSDPYAELAEIAPYAVNAQVKVDIYPNGQHEMTDLARVIKILRDAGYSGWVALEYEAKEEPKTAIPRWIDELKPLLD